MSRDDYFVIAYRILAYLYKCFKAGEVPNDELFDAEALKISNGYWINVMESLHNEGYITGVLLIRSVGGTSGVKITDLKITQKGIEFLQENSMMAKAKEFLVTAGTIISGI